MRTEKHPDDGRIGKKIDWSLVIPSITRPTWEPPALEVLDFFETLDEFFDFDLSSDTMKAAWPEADVRTRMVDMMSECHPLRTYHAWVEETKKAAEEVGDEEKVEFYRRLAVAVMRDWKDAFKETIPLINANWPGTPIQEWESEDEEKQGDQVVLAESAFCLAASFLTAYEDESIHNLEEPLDLIDLDASSVTPEADFANDLTSILKLTGITEMSEVDRLLS